MNFAMPLNPTLRVKFNKKLLKRNLKIKNNHVNIFISKSFGYGSNDPITVKASFEKFFLI